MVVIESSTGERRHGKATVVHVAGRLDLTAADRLRQEVHELAESGCQHVVVDLEDVEFIDSSGLGAIVGALKLLRKGGGNLSVAALNSQALEVMRLTTLDRVIPVFGTVDEALRAA